MVLHSFFNSRFNDFLRFFLWLSYILAFFKVNVVLNRTVVVDRDWRFDNLCSSTSSESK